MSGLSKVFVKRDSRGVACRQAALENVSLAVDEGEVCGLVGESGCGKTTLARCVLGLYKPDAGTIRFQGRDLSLEQGRRLRRIRRRIQSVFQDPVLSLNPRLTAGQIIEEPLLIHRMGDSSWRSERVAEMLEAVGLPADSGSRYPGSFSGGERQRIAIARALAPGPRLLVADEPVSALDPPVRGQILSLLESLKETHNLSILFITHAIDLLPRICDRAAVMFQGRFTEIAPVPELLANPLHPYTRFLLSTHRIKTSASAPDGARDPVLAGWRDPISDLESPPGDLEEVAPGHWVAAV